MTMAQKINSFRQWLREEIAAHKSGEMMSLREAMEGEKAYSEVLREFNKTFRGNVDENDPSANPDWCRGLDYGQLQLCAVLGVDPNTVTWDAATETLDGDVQAAIRNVFRAKYGENWTPDG